MALVDCWVLVAQIWLRLFLTPAASYPGSKWFPGILGVVAEIWLGLLLGVGGLALSIGGVLLSLGIFRPDMAPGVSHSCCQLPWF